jgi:TolB-like protein/tetratricopeptide (TPR) repeat protein
MGAETPNKVTTAAQAVFLSYASQDADAARRICDALRAEGIEVWFDQSELRGGDAWDQRIRHEILDCALFIPVISPNTASRREGYFRLEWDLADQRSHRMARDQAFIVPICLDATPGAGTDVPESFHRVHWTRLPVGETPPEFVVGIKRLLSLDAPTTARLPAGASPFPATTGRSTPLRRALAVAVAVLGLAALASLLITKPWISKPAALVTTSNAPYSPGAAPTAFNPPPHSIAVLPFVNMSGDKEQEYFSEGLTEELLNSLSRINELQIAARTSSFSFQGEHPDIATVAHKLNVGSILEGSVRRSVHTVRITAQLVNGSTGYRLWSQTYDRDLGDVLALQTEIATAVASALKVTLVGDVATKIEVGGTRNPAALDAYLRGTKAFLTVHDRRRDEPVAIAAYTEAISLDPNYALAYAGRSRALGVYAGQSGGATLREFYDKALADAQHAIALAPELADGHMALGMILTDQGSSFDFARARDELKQALALAPGNARVSRNFGINAVYMGHFDEGIAAVRRAVVLDPLNPASQVALGNALLIARRYREAVTAFDQGIGLDREDPEGYGNRGLAYYALGDYSSARSSCEAISDNEFSEFCLALTYDKLGRHADARAMLAKFRARYGDSAAYQYAGIYAQWGDRAKALEWLEAALRLRDGGLFQLKTDPALDPLRNEARFQAIQRALRFPD